MTAIQRTSLRAGLLAAMAGWAVSAEATTVPIFNGSFEAGTTGRPTGLASGLRFGQLNTTGSGWDTYTGLQGWTNVSGGRIEIHADRDPTKVDAQDGDYYISLDGGVNSTIQQSVALSKGTYLLSFWYSPESTNAASNAIRYSVGNLVSGQVTRGTNGATLGAWTQVQSLFRVTTIGSYSLAFGALGSANHVGGFLDNVTIAAVPVPAAGLGLLTGLLGLFGIRRRRHG